MSLLNDMLRDLSQDMSRGAPPFSEREPGAASPEAQRDLFSQSSVAKATPRNFLPSLVAFVTVLAAIVGWRYFFISQDFQSDAAKAVTPGQVTAETQHNLTGANTPSSDDGIETAEVVDVKESSSELTERLASLESAITNLAMVVANNQLDAAKDIPHAENTGGNNAVDDVSTDTLVSRESFSIQEPFPAGQQTSLENEVALAQSDAIESDPSLFIAPNRAWQDEQTAAQAAEDFKTGRMEQGIARLQTFIANHPSAPRSSALLLDLYCEQENIAAAEQLLLRATFLAPEVKTFYSAKIALLNNKPDEALALLEGSLAQAEQDENYRALLAGLYQRNGMNEQAASHYRRLLISFGEKPAYWLGFALAQDALNQTQLALQAYQRVTEYSDLQPPVRQYVEQRLAALGQ